jgi:hypothetical protein
MMEQAAQCDGIMPLPWTLPLFPIQNICATMSHHPSRAENSRDAERPERLLLSEYFGATITVYTRSPEHVVHIYLVRQLTICNTHPMS